MIDERMKLLAGQRLVAGFEGYTVPESFQKLIRDCKIGNVILFRRNIQSAEQLRELCVFLHCLIRMETGLPPMILLDEEGGTVSRLGELGSVSPSAMAQGATGDPENAFRVGRMIGQELRAVGVNFNCAPILDCNTNPKNPVIGVRSFGGDPEKVADFGAAYARGLREAGVIACGKHFPGHGDTETDSHLGLPVVNKSLEEIERVELVSFRRAIEEKIDALMTAHVVFPALEPERIPSTVSRKVMTGLLREKMGFEGLIVTDCMEMDAIKRQFGSARGALMALQAGVDMTLICHTEAFQREAAELIVEAMQDGRLSMEEAQESYRRIADVKRRKAVLPLTDPAVIGCPEHRSIAESILRQAVKVLYAPAGKPLPALDENTLFFGCSNRAASYASDQLALCGPERLSRHFGGTFGGLLLDEAGFHSCQGRTVVACLSPQHDLPRVMKQVRTLAASGAQVIAAAMATPYCLDELPDNVWKTAVYQYDELGLARLQELLENGK